MANQTSYNSPTELTPEIVGKSFIDQYYEVLHAQPEVSHLFYEESSVLSRPGPDGILTSVTTMQGIHDKIMSFDYKDCEVDKVKVHSQQCNGGVIVGVVGFLTGKENMSSRKFTQTFFLAPKTKGYFVLNDFLFFVDTPKPSSPVPADYVDKHTPTTPLIHDPEITHLTSNHASTPAEEVSVNVSNVSAQSDTKGSVVKEAAVPKPSANSSEDKVLPVSESAANGQEDSGKTSYASILAKERALASPDHVPAGVIVRVAPSADQQHQPKPKDQLPSKSQQPSRNQQQPLRNQQQPLRNQQQPIRNQQLPPRNQHPPKNQDAHPSAKPEAKGAQAEAIGVYVRGLPIDITYDRLFDALSKFGTLDRAKMQILLYTDGFCCGFADFDSSVSASNAVKASELPFGDKVAKIEYKKLKSPRGGNNRAKFPSGKGNFGDDNGRGGYRSNGRLNGR